MLWRITKVRKEIENATGVEVGEVLVCGGWSHDEMTFEQRL